MPRHLKQTYTHGTHTYWGGRTSRGKRLISKIHKGIKAIRLNRLNELLGKDKDIYQDELNMGG